MIGRTLGHYRIAERIGAGGMGVVYRARDERLDRDVALKLLPVELLADASAVKSFREEAQALSRLNHPNIATIHDFDSQDGLNFLVMEYIPGITLDKKIAAGAIAEKEVVRLGTQLAQGLHAAHSEGVVHRDLKPSNLRVTPDRRLKILDFGLAGLLANSDPDVTQTSLNARPQAGTLPYMAPEQLHGQPGDERSDIYAVGAVLYEMTTGQRLFPEKHGARLMNSILYQSPRPPRELNGQISLEMQSIIQKALDKEPERRYQSAKELQVDMQRMRPSTSDIQLASDGENSGPLPLEIAHVLFMDITAYSKMPMDLQKRTLEDLQKTVRSTSEFTRARCADKLISLPSGDGMALVFFGDAESPCRCALEVSRVLRNQPETKLRMGVHTGPVYRVADISANRNVVGGGINMAQRVMDCGDSGHILVSKDVANLLAQVSGWDSSLHDLGEAKVKHEVRIHLYNLYTADAGNPETPKKLRDQAASKSDLRKTRRAARPDSRHRSGVKARIELKDQAAGSRTAEAKIAVGSAEASHSSRWSLRKRLRVLGLLVVALGIFALCVPAVRYGTFFANSTPKTPPGVPPLAAGKFLAVIPFGTKGDAAMQPLADGLSEGLSSKLLSSRELSVASARATADIDPRATLATIGRTLAVNLLVSGTVKGDEKTIQVTVNLDEVGTGRQRFSKRFSGTKKDLPSLEGAIYTSVLTALELKPSSDELVRAVAPPKESTEAYELYYRGRTAFRGHPDINQVKTAIGLYEQALQIDNNFALAHASMADASVAMYRETHDAIWIHRAQGAADLAKKLDDNLKEAHLSLGNLYRTIGKTDEAILEFKRALQLSPTCDDCYRRLGRAYEDAGKKIPAIMALQNAVTLNPYYWQNQNELGLAHLRFEEFDKALAAFRSYVELDPTNPIGHQNIGAVYFSQGKFEQSIPEFEKAIELQSSDATLYSDLGLALLYLKRYSEALPILEKSAQMHPDDEAIVGNLADGYRWSGQRERAIQAYHRAISLAQKELDINPRDSAALGSLGLYYAKTGEMTLAQYNIRRARSIDASDANLVYNDAVIQALSNQPELATESLGLAFERGFSPEQAMLDPDLSSLHENPAFKKLMKEFLDRPK